MEITTNLQLEGMPDKDKAQVLKQICEQPISWRRGVESEHVLEEKDRKLFTFRAPRGLMRFKRLVMGNNPASSEAHRHVAKVVEGLEGALQIKDDVLLYGTEGQH